MIDRRRQHQYHNLASPTRSSSRLKEAIVRSSGPIQIPGVKLSLITQNAEENERLSQERIRVAKEAIHRSYQGSPNEVPPLILRDVILFHRNKIIEKFTVDQYNLKQGLYQAYRRDSADRVEIEFFNDEIVDDSLVHIQSQIQPQTPA